MSILKDKKIPAVAITSLVLGGACRGGDGGGGGGRTTASLARDYCEVMSTCTPDEFEFDYGTVDACAARWDANISEDLVEMRAENGEVCVDAFLDYFACYTNSLRDCDYEEEECEAVWDRFAEACDIDIYSYYE